MLPVNFHRTFIPERKYIASLLDFVALGHSGSIEEIAIETGIPMGKSTGKTAAIIDYSKGMGLIKEITERAKSKFFKLTEFGQAVFEEDKFMGEEVTQTIAHFNLCNNRNGALIWNAVFSLSNLGKRFTKEQLEEYLCNTFGYGKKRTGPLVSTYTDDAALARTNILREENGVIIREKAPLTEIFSKPYSIYITMLLDEYFLNEKQVTLSDFNRITNLFSICGWEELEIAQCMQLIEKTGFISVDRQIEPWIIERKVSSNRSWKDMWDDIA